MTLLRETWQSVHTLDRSMITWWKGLRIFLILLAIQGWAFVTSHESIGVSMSLGAAFVGGLLDLDGAYRHRIFSMGTGVVALTLTVFFGAWASSDPVAHIAGMAVIGFLGGFVVVGGPRATMLGVLCMVAYCVFSGEPAMFTSAVGDASAFFLGGVFATAVITSSWLFRRVDGYRELLALFYRGLGHACSGDALSAVDVIHVERLRRLRFALDVDGQGEILQQWFDDIVVQSTIIRCNLIALSREGDEINNVEATQKLQEYFLAVRSLSKGVARVLRWHWFRRFLEKDLAALFEATRQLEPFGSLIDQELTAKNGTAFTRQGRRPSSSSIGKDSPSFSLERRSLSPRRASFTGHHDGRPLLTSLGSVPGLLVPYDRCVDGETRSRGHQRKSALAHRRNDWWRLRGFGDLRTTPPGGMVRRRAGSGVWSADHGVSSL